MHHLNVLHKQKLSIENRIRRNINLPLSEFGFFLFGIQTCKYLKLTIGYRIRDIMWKSWEIFRFLPKIVN